MKIRSLIFGASVLVLALSCQAEPSATANSTPSPRLDKNSQLAHQELLKKAKAGGIDLYFLGDSITRRWGATDYPEFLAHWRKNLFGWNAGDFGWGGDGIQHMLWRIQEGELDGVNPKVIVILGGTNNVGKVPPSEAVQADIVQGMKNLIELCQRKAPTATIVLTAIFPRNDNPAVMPAINHINTGYEKLANGKSVRFLNVNGKFADKNDVLFEGMTVDKLHPTLKGYQVWMDGLRPILTELLGPPAAADHAPAPTGDPSSANKRER